MEKEVRLSPWINIRNLSCFNEFLSVNREYIFIEKSWIFFRSIYFKIDVIEFFDSYMYLPLKLIKKVKKTITWDIIIVLKFNQFKKKTFKIFRYQMKTLSIINVAVLFKVGNQIFFFRQNKIIVCWYNLRSIKIYFYINFFIDSRQNCGSTGKFFPNLLWISQNCYSYFF